MHARVSTFEGSPEQVDELRRYATERVVPALEQIDGYAGILSLADRRSGKVIAVVLWETEEARRDSEEAKDLLRAGAYRDKERRRRACGRLTASAVDTWRPATTRSSSSGRESAWPGSPGEGPERRAGPRHRRRRAYDK